ncbi:hypothetical protein [Paenibacillus sinopodophylli]|uniref:hypothetical protein n=1 Tax=Paenibacillus sinopodophylli TaxID=1837342 RepID=UPI00110CA337|nr:hypothetical protein [Paenibacillus sinopodophylli]
MEKQSSSPTQNSFVFNIEVLVDAKNNAEALEQLLHSLNRSGYADFRILSGIQLGDQIDQRKMNATAIIDIPVEPNSTENVTTTNQAAAVDSDKKETKKSAKKSDKPSTEALDELSYFDRIKAIMKNNTLIRLIVNKGLGIKLNIPCRIINIDEAENIITVYHVDEKQVYTFRLNEIEDFFY